MSNFTIEFRDKVGAWQFGSAGFAAIEAAVEAAKDLSEQLKTLTRVMDQTGRVHGLVEVVFA